MKSKDETSRRNGKEGDARGRKPTGRKGTEKAKGKERADNVKAKQPKAVTASAKEQGEVREIVRKKKGKRGAPKGSHNAANSFLYSSGIHPWEWEFVERVYGKQADLDAIVTVLQTKLQRAIDAQSRWEEQACILAADKDGSQFPVDEHETESVTIRNTDGIVHKTDRQKQFRRRKDFSDEIKSLSRLITEITLRQAELRQLTLTEDIRSQLASEIRKDAIAASDDLDGADD